MSEEIKFEEKQYLGYNKLSFLRRMVLALFCFFAYYWSEEQNKSGDLFFIMGIAIIVISALLVLVLHFHTQVQSGSITLDGLWTARKVKIDLNSIEQVRKAEYSRFFFNKSVYNLHRKGTIRFFTRGTECVELIDKDGLVYLIGSQKADELTKVLEKRLNNNIYLKNKSKNKISNEEGWRQREEYFDTYADCAGGNAYLQSVVIRPE